MFNCLSRLANNAYNYMCPFPGSSSNNDLEKGNVSRKRMRLNAKVQPDEAHRFTSSQQRLSDSPADSVELSRIAPSPLLMSRNVEFVKIAESGDLAGLKASLRQGADPNADDEQGRTALIAAAAAGNEKVVDFLIDPKNPQLLVSDPEERSRKYHRVVLNGSDHAGNSAFMEAALHGHPHIMQKLMDAVLDDSSLLCQQNHNGETALILAAAQGNAKCVKLILDRELKRTRKDAYYQSCLDIRDYSEKNALSHAMKGPHNECAFLLYQYRKILEDAR